MALALELGLSRDADHLVRRIWQSLEDAGVPSLATHLPRIRPHVTLAVTEDADGLRRAAGRLREAFHPVSVELVGPAFFRTDPAILFLAVGPTCELLAVHQDVADVLEAAGVDGWPHYRPGTWMPHCTLSMGVPADRLGAAVDACLAWQLPVATPLGDPMLTDSVSGASAPL